MIETFQDLKNKIKVNPESLSNQLGNPLFIIRGYLKNRESLIANGIIEKEPSPDLLPGLGDHIMVGIPYKQIDLILLAKEND